MRNYLYGALAGVALATASIGNAAVVVTSVTNLNNPNPALPGSQVTVGDTTTINFGANPVGPGAFTSGFSFDNPNTGLYNFVLGSSTPGVSFNSATLTGPGVNDMFATLHTSSPAALYLNGVYLAADTVYTLTFAGNTNSNSTGSFTGNVTINPAVPEPATWAMMLVGFAGIGLTVRRRRPRTIAQLA